MTAVKTMTRYFGTKEIKAFPMTRQEYNDYRGWDLPADEDGRDMGYLVEYVDGGDPNHPDHAGYISWSPWKVFHRAYQPNGALTFGHALVALKAGLRVQRSGWNGKGMFVWQKDGATVRSDMCHDPKLKAIVDANGGVMEALPTLCLKTADNKILTGWLASQTDMLAEDWKILDTGEPL